MTAELPALPVIFEDENGDQDGAVYTSSEMNRYVEVAAERERILLARIAELDLALSIARQNAELLTGYWKAATAEASAMRNRLRDAGLLDEEGDDADGW